jgi:hypothetical protein
MPAVTSPLTSIKTALLSARIFCPALLFPSETPIFADVQRFSLNALSVWNGAQAAAKRS